MKFYTTKKGPQDRVIVSTETKTIAVSYTDIYEVVRIFNPEYYREISQMEGMLLLTEIHQYYTGKIGKIYSVIEMELRQDINLNKDDEKD